MHFRTLEPSQGRSLRKALLPPPEKKLPPPALDHKFLFREKKHQLHFFPSEGAPIESCGPRKVMKSKYLVAIKPRMTSLKLTDSWSRFALRSRCSARCGRRTGTRRSPSSIPARTGSTAAWPSLFTGPRRRWEGGFGSGKIIHPLEGPFSAVAAPNFKMKE